MTNCSDLILNALPSKLSCVHVFPIVSVDWQETFQTNEGDLGSLTLVFIHSPISILSLLAQEVVVRRIPKLGIRI
jgi:hypothetical protein